jgi:hypothetical protein
MVYGRPTDLNKLVLYTPLYARGDYSTNAVVKIKYRKENTMTKMPIPQPLREQVVCNNGTTLSVQASAFHYCSPKEDRAKSYSLVEVGFIKTKSGRKVKMPKEWKQYAEGRKLSADVFGWVPVQIVIDFVNSRGGLKSGGGGQMLVNLITGEME